MRHKNFVYLNFVGIRLLYSLYPQSVIFYSVLQMLHGVSWVLQVMSVQYFFDGISQNQGGTDSSSVKTHNEREGPGYRKAYLGL